MRCKTARAVDLIHGDAPDSLQRKEEEKPLKRDPTEVDRNFEIQVGLHSLLNFTEGQGNNGQTNAVVLQEGRSRFKGNRFLPAAKAGGLQKPQHTF